ncbi:ETS-related transcription factor Elf-5-like [Nylanderia fulva]|uniref:ETS-related transcription factor Elf-5-like n=1 Tax=Nylanderia fulva TaxID=613905 RepID=UPI0010FB1CC2|nr:ETS-related transcription factor Elf-5-like [Nylanderia fulva]XP_029159037.1 ETS-related transcription factor Elf-5-like [Nylanderia fulva]
MYPSFINLNEDENNHLLLDMDSLVPRHNNFFANRSHESTKKKSHIGKEIYNREMDGTGWPDKPIRNWCQEETMEWFMSAAAYLGQQFSSFHSFAVSGEELVTFTRQDFINHEPLYGDQLYDLLHSQRTSNMRPSFDSCSIPIQEDEYAPIISSNISDAESDNSVEIKTKRLPGRPRVLKLKKNPATQGKLWEFIRDLLRSRETCPSLICWEDYSQAKFRFVKSDEVAKRWGSRKGNTKMTYEKLSRAMRYYYKSKIFQPVLGRRLVYQFGPNAKGWQTDNPNFRN